MNKVIVRVGNLTFEADVGNQKQAFAFIADVQDVFGETKCGMCGSENVKFDCREHDGNKYYKMRCVPCSAQFEFGQHKNSENLFTKRWDKENKRPMANGGWFHWQGGGGQPQSSRSSAPQGRQADPRLQTGSAPDVEAIRAKWKQMIGSNPPVDAFNNFYADNWLEVPQAMRNDLNAAIRGLASRSGWTWDGQRWTDAEIPF